MRDDKDKIKQFVISHSSNYPVSNLQNFRRETSKNNIRYEGVITKKIVKRLKKHYGNGININCIDCHNCFGCIGCIRCIDCTDCYNCSYCEECHNCKFSANCVYGRNMLGKKYLVNTRTNLGVKR